MIDRSEWCYQNIYCFQTAKMEGIPLINESLSLQEAEDYGRFSRSFIWRMCESFNHILTTSALQLTFTKKFVEKRFHAA